MENLEHPDIGYIMATGYGPPNPKVWSPFSGDDDDYYEEEDEDG